MKILPLTKNKKNKDCLIPPQCPQGSCLFIAPSNSGKSTLICNMLARQNTFGYLTWYQNVFVLSPTSDLDETWDVLKPPHYVPWEHHCTDGKKRMTAAIHFLNPSWEGVDAILDAQEKLPEQRRGRTLIIADDMASEMKTRAHPALTRLVFSGRHRRVWFWLTSQMYRSVPRQIRTNSPFIVIFRVNRNEAKTLAEELSVTSEQEFIDALNRATEPRFGFLTVDMARAPTERLGMNFEER